MQTWTIFDLYLIPFNKNKSLSLDQVKLTNEMNFHKTKYTKFIFYKQSILDSDPLEYDT